MSFWKTKKLGEMTTEEWESLCDRCGKCCLIKLEDEDTREIHFTSVVCKYIDLKTCRCTRYDERTRLVPQCLDLKQHDFAEFNWLPSTCAYRLLSDGEDLPAWHPLLTGNGKSVEKAGISIKSYAMKETEIDRPEEHIIRWLD
ncbi:YcgN family cysteine cluster protein [Methylosarcina fibrata]|uniref:YcgN family cysteine cluster protein n=1 Tax=Methylosarcina fibrata TaxID=105972 RepID=UPI00037E53DA|nr:YcgN family cysteine cluster protein [Methylosarcina fibrata]